MSKLLESLTRKIRIENLSPDLDRFFAYLLYGYTIIAREKNQRLHFFHLDFKDFENFRNSEHRHKALQHCARLLCRNIGTFLLAAKKEVTVTILDKQMQEEEWCVYRFGKLQEKRVFKDITPQP